MSPALSPTARRALSPKKDLAGSPVCSVDRLSPSRRLTDETTAPVLPTQLDIASPEERHLSPRGLMVYEDSDSDSVSKASARTTSRLRDGKENSIGAVCTSPLVLQRKLLRKGDRKPLAEVVDDTHAETRSCVMDTASLRDAKKTGELNRVALEILP
jgi:hypothetical protein